MDDVDPIDDPVLSTQEGKSYKTISHLPVSRFPPHILYHLLKENSAITATSTGQFGIFPEQPFVYHPRSHPLPQVHPQPNFQTEMPSSFARNVKNSTSRPQGFYA